MGMPLRCHSWGVISRVTFRKRFTLRVTFQGALVNVVSRAVVLIRCVKGSVSSGGVSFRLSGLGRILVPMHLSDPGGLCCLCLHPLQSIQVFLPYSYCLNLPSGPLFRACLLLFSYLCPLGLLYSFLTPPTHFSTSVCRFCIPHSLQLHHSLLSSLLEPLFPFLLSSSTCIHSCLHTMHPT